jgi:hypothetical protein
MKFVSGVSALSAGQMLTELSNKIIYIIDIYVLSALFEKMKTREEREDLFRGSLYSADTLTNSPSPLNINNIFCQRSKR